MPVEYPREARRIPFENASPQSLAKFALAVFAATIAGLWIGEVAVIALIALWIGWTARTFAPVPR